VIIWGQRTRNKTVQEGTFHCPQEGADRPFALKEARRWFTLYFIPVIPLQEQGSFVECQSCMGTFITDVLKTATTEQLTENLASAMRYAVVAIVRASGELTDAEREAAVAVMQRYEARYTSAQLDHDLVNIPSEGAHVYLSHCAGSMNTFGKETLIAQLAYVAGSDGVVNPTERTVIEQAGHSLAMTPANIAGVLANTAPAQLPNSQ